MPAPNPTRPVVAVTMLHDLSRAHAHVVPEAGATLALTIGDVNASVRLVDVASVLRQLLTDALAQLDAIAP